MGIFDGLSGGQSAKKLGSNLVNQVSSNFVSQFQSKANSIVGQALGAALSGLSFAGGLGGSINGGGGMTSEQAFAKHVLQLAMQIQYAQGWQFIVEADGLSDLFMYVRDVTYGTGTIETDQKIIGGIQFNKPTHIAPGTVTMTVRDNQERKVATWFDQRKSLVINPDGTLNLAPTYLMKIRIYHVGFDGAKTLDREMKVFPTERGAITRAYDQVGEYYSFPLTFMPHSSADSSLSGVVSSNVSSMAGDAVSSAGKTLSNIIKF